MLSTYDKILQRGNFSIMKKSEILNNAVLKSKDVYLVMKSSGNFTYDEKFVTDTQGFNSITLMNSLKRFNNNEWISDTNIKLFNFYPNMLGLISIDP